MAGAYFGSAAALSSDAACSALTGEPATGPFTPGGAAQSLTLMVGASGQRVGAVSGAGQLYAFTYSGL